MQFTDLTPTQRQQALAVVLAPSPHTVPALVYATLRQQTRPFTKVWSVQLQVEEPLSPDWTPTWVTIDWGTRVFLATPARFRRVRAVPDPTNRSQRWYTPTGERYPTPLSLPVQEYHTPSWVALDPMLAPSHRLWCQLQYLRWDWLPRTWTQPAVERWVLEHGTWPPGLEARAYKISFYHDKGGDGPVVYRPPVRHLVQVTVRADTRQQAVQFARTWFIRSPAEVWPNVELVSGERSAHRRVLEVQVQAAGAGLA